jgi:O-antigen ligase
MTLLLPIVAALSAILILPGASFFFDVIPKVVVILAGAALVFVLPRRWPGVLWKAPHAKPLRLFTILATVQTVIIIATTFTSTHRQLSILGSTWRRSGAIAEIAVLVLAVAGAWQLASDRSSLRLFLRVTILASIPISIYGLLQYFGIDPLLNAAGYHFGEGVYQIVRPPATLGHAAYFATYLLYASFGGAGLVAIESERPWRFAAIVASVLAMFAIVLSGTRAALLGFVLGAIYVVIVGQAFSLPILRTRWRFFVATCALLIAIGAFYISPLGEHLRARAFWSSEDRYGGSRLLLWRDSLKMSSGQLKMSSGHLLLGVGPESFAIEFPKHQSVELARQFPDFYNESAHNIFLDALTAKGIFGFAALLALTALCLRYARGPIGGAFIAMLVAQQFTSFTLPTELYFYLTAAILLSDFETDPQPEMRRSWWPTIFAIPFVGMAIYLATGDALLAAARIALDKNDNDFDKAWLFQERARAWNMTADVYFSRRYFAIPNERARAFAMASALRATQTADDRQNALLNLAVLQSPSGDAAAVEQTLRAAIAAAPAWYKSHWLLAQVLALEGRRDEARAEAQTAIDLGGGRHTEVVQTLESLR